MDANPPTFSQPVATTLCWEWGTQYCTSQIAGAIVKLCAYFLAYGIHLVLFTACIFVLARRRYERIHVHRFLVTALFVLATCGLVLEACNATLTMYTYHIFGVIPCDKPESAGSKVEITTGWGQRPSLSDIESATESPRYHINNLDRAMQAMIVTLK
ncbi:hypothetical protein PM082_014442 [Marasmius tenuissimus]|nr:hypothetical protein PM082_014442 [Marasmius tenuissimus]